MLFATISIRAHNKQLHRQATWFLRPRDIVEPGKFAFKYHPIEKKQRAEILILCGKCNVSIHGDVAQKCLDFSLAHITGVSFVVEQDKAPDPIDISMFSANAVMLGSDSSSNTVEQTKHLGDVYKHDF